VHFHCSAGKDRTSNIAALLLSLAGVEDDTIVADYALTTSIAAPLIERLRVQALTRGTDPASGGKLPCLSPETMRSTLSHLNEIMVAAHTAILQAWASMSGHFES